jgi:hypothetical protein
MADDSEWRDDDLVHAVELLAETFKARSIPYALLGGLALGFRGNPRFTQDVDVVLSVPQLALPGLLDDLAKEGFNFDTTTVIRQYVKEHMTVLHFGQVHVDWIKPVLPLYHRTIRDATARLWTEGHSIQVATAECLVVTKLASFRLQDQADIESLLSANRDTIDLAVIRSEWLAVADSDNERTVWLEDAIARMVAQKPPMK